MNPGMSVGLCMCVCMSVCVCVCLCGVVNTIANDSCPRRNCI